MRALARFYDRVTDACGALAAVLVFGVTALIVADVLLRNMLRAPLGYSVELSEYTMLYLTALTAPWLLKRGEHVRIDLLLHRVPAIVGWLCELLCDLIGLALSLLMTYYGVRVAIASIESGTKLVKQFTIPEWWILLALPLMFALLVIGFILRLHACWTGPRRPRVEGAQI